MESIEERYYLYSNDSNFKAIYPKNGKPLPLSIKNDDQAKFAGKFFSDEDDLKNWWVEKETIRTIKTVKRLV